MKKRADELSQIQHKIMNSLMTLVYERKDLSSGNERLVTTIEALRVEHAKLKAQLEGVSAARASLEAECRDLRDSNQKKQAIIQSLEKASKHLQQQIDSAVTRVAREPLKNPLN